MKRMRGRNHRGSGGAASGGPIRHHNGNIPLNRNHVFDSNGPEVRVRGTAQQLSEKYLQLGRDATSSGDRVMAESYFQHAEHYFRILNAINQASAPSQGYAQPSHQNGHRRGDIAEGRGGDGESDDDGQPNGMGEQPGESREIPISAAPGD